MKRLILWLLFVGVASAQNLTTVTAANIFQSGPTLLASGTIYFSGVDATDRPISYQVGGLGQQIRYPIVCTITNGAIVQPCQVANTALTNPVNLCFDVTIKDRTNKLVLGGPNGGYQCAQPTGGTWDFDNYVPNIHGMPIVNVPIATEIINGMVRAPNCLALGGSYFPQSINTDGTWNCVLGGGKVDAIVSFNVLNPDPTISGVYEHKWSKAVTVNRVSCSTNVGATVSVDFDIRTEAAPNATGTSVIGGAGLICNGTTPVTTVFNASTIGANLPVALLVTSTSGVPTIVRVHIETTTQ